MKSPGVVLGVTLSAAALTMASAEAWQVTPEEHAAHHPGGPEAKGMAGMKGMDMHASNTKLDELVAKMNAAQGQAKTDAMAALLTALVQQHKTIHGNMGDMMSMMKGGAAK